MARHGHGAAAFIVRFGNAADLQGYESRRLGRQGSASGDELGLGKWDAAARRLHARPRGHQRRGLLNVLRAPKQGRLREDIADPGRRSHDGRSPGRDRGSSGLRRALFGWRKEEADGRAPPGDDRVHGFVIGRRRRISYVPGAPLSLVCAACKIRRDAADVFER